MTNITKETIYSKVQKIAARIIKKEGISRSAALRKAWKEVKDNNKKEPSIYSKVQKIAARIKLSNKGMSHSKALKLAWKEVKDNNKKEPSIYSKIQKTAARIIKKEGISRSAALKKAWKEVKENNFQGEVAEISIYSKVQKRAGELKKKNASLTHSKALKLAWKEHKEAEPLKKKNKTSNTKVIDLQSSKRKKRTYVKPLPLKDEYLESIVNMLVSKHGYNRGYALKRAISIQEESKEFYRELGSILNRKGA